MKLINSDSFNFTRCRRADGTHYGTAGQCRKGSEDPLSEFKKLLGSSDRLKLIGEGFFGKVYDVGDGVVIKHGQISEQEVKALLHLKSLPEIPRVIATSMESNNNSISILAMTKVPGIPLSQLTEYEQQEEWDSFLPTLRKIHKLGVAHNDLHNGNVLLDEKNWAFSVIDFGRASLNEPADQISDLVTLGWLSSRDQGDTIDRIITENLQGKKLSSVSYKPIKEQQNIINSIWKDIDREIL